MEAPDAKSPELVDKVVKMYGPIPVSVEPTVD